MTRTIYIAGPMRGIPEFNFTAFNDAERKWQLAGWRVISPVRVGELFFRNHPDTPGGEYLKRDIAMIALYCDAIALLPGWEASTGARCEVAVSKVFGLQFYDATQVGRAITPPAIVHVTGYDEPAGPVDTLENLIAELNAWQAATFPQATPHSVTKHLLKEAAELHADPLDDAEMADVFFLFAQLIKGRDLKGAVRAKLRENMNRTWGAPDADGVVEHV